MAQRSARAFGPSLKRSAHGLRSRGGLIGGTARTADCNDVQESTAQLLSRRDVAYVDVRSARNNCFQTRIAAAP
ncbi:DUF1203 domain-containing protein [Nioella sp.]|uniref:DUF1203 domain-containing protein n=1 Tax=Nioella sp. TaxID=1912091 RepID=UPI003A84D412